MSRKGAETQRIAKDRRELTPAVGHFPHKSAIIAPLSARLFSRLSLKRKGRNCFDREFDVELCRGAPPPSYQLFIRNCCFFHRGAGGAGPGSRRRSGPQAARFV